MMNEEDARKEWARCRPMVEAALRHSAGTHTIEDVEDGVRASRYIVWTGTKSVAVTEFHQFPQARFLHIFLAGGDLEELKSMVPTWVNFAQFNGCSQLTICGRRGWERALREQGWNADLVCLTLPVRTVETLQ